MLTSILATTVVDAYLVWKYNRGLERDEDEERTDGFTSRLLGFVAKVVSQLDAQPVNENIRLPTDTCALVKNRLGGDGKRIQQRCSMCTSANRRSKQHQRSSKTIWHCQQIGRAHV